MITEDQLTTRLVKYYKDSRDEHELSVEQHYNYYGDRGIVDLVVEEQQSGNIRLYEIKSNAAIDSATGANEIIRQFNRMRRYFFRDESTPTPDGRVTFELCFAPTYEAYRHVHENAELYNTAAKSDVDIGLCQLAKPDRVSVQVTMRPYDRDTITPVVLFSNLADYRERIDEIGQTGVTLLDDWIMTQYEELQKAD